MPAPGSTTGDAGGTVGGDTVKTVFNRAALRAFRANYVYRRIADVKWAGKEPMPGNAVTFTLITPLSVATSAIAEATEPTPVNVSDSQKTVTLVEYGNAVKTTKKLRLTSFLNLDLEIAYEIGQNMEESMDIVARDVLVAGTNVLYGGAATSRVTVAAGHTMTANNLRRLRAYLSGLNTPYPMGMNAYPLIIHPDVSYDLQVESGTQSWTSAHTYAQPTEIFAGEIGMLGGVRVIENSNAKIFTNAGVGSTVEVYVSISAGLQALGEAVGEAQHVVMSGPFDDLQRFLSVGWYALEGFGRIRENSLVRYETSSSLATNV